MATPLVFSYSQSDSRSDTTRVANAGSEFSRLVESSNFGYQQDNYNEVFRLGFFGEDPAQMMACMAEPTAIPVRQKDEVVSY